MELSKPLKEGSLEMCLLTIIPRCCATLTPEWTIPLFLTLCIPIFPTDFKSDLWQTIECTIYSLFRRWTQVLSAMQHLAENWMDGSQFLFQLFCRCVDGKVMRRCSTPGRDQIKTHLVVLRDCMQDRLSLKVTRGDHLCQFGTCLLAILRNYIY
jgi:hypothetical protein